MYMFVILSPFGKHRGGGGVYSHIRVLTNLHLIYSFITVRARIIFISIKVGSKW